MLATKRSWMFMMLALSFLVVVSSAHAVSDDLFRYAETQAIAEGPSNQIWDAEVQANAGNAYGDWEVATIPTSGLTGQNNINWFSVGTLPGQGLTGMSTDTPDGSNFSIFADDNGYLGGSYNLSTYAFGFTLQTGWTGQYFISYDYKGDIYTSIGAQGGSMAGVSGTATVSAQTDTWTHTSGVIEALAPGVNGFSFYVYDNSSGGRAAYMDNLSITPYTAPPARSVGFFPNSEMEHGGSPTSGPDYWGSGPATLSVSTDIPIIGDGYHSLSILGSTGLGSSYVVAYGYEGDHYADPPEALTNQLVTPDTEYELSFWHKGDVRVAMNDSVGGWFYAEHFTGSTEWTEEIVTVTTGEFQTGHVSMYFYDLNFEDAIPLLIDNAYFGLLTGGVLLEGDANRDGVVSAGDYASVQANFGSTGAAGILGDANGDGVVSAGDYASVQANFGATAGPVVAPEPATMTLIGLGGLALIRRRRK